VISAEEAFTAAAYFGAPGTINSKPASATVALEVFLRSKDKIVDTGQIQKTFFMTTRSLCCCPKRKVIPGEGVVYESTQALVGPGTVPTIEAEHKIRAAMRHEMVRSLVSSHRSAPKPFAKTQLAFDLVLPILLNDSAARAALMERAVHALPENLEERVPKSFRDALQHVSRLQLLSMRASTLMKATGLQEDTIHDLKTAILRKPPAPTLVSEQVEQLRAARRKLRK
jgi:hypothetical protein